MIAPAGRQIDDLFPLRGDLGLAFLIRKAQDRVGVGDIEILADERHAERRVEVLQEDCARLRDSIAVGIAQQRDTVGAGDRSAGAAKHQPRDPAHDAALLLPPRRGVGLRHQHVAVRQHIEPARMIEPGRQGVDRETLGRNRHAAVGPADRRRDIDGRDHGLVRLRQGRVRPDARLGRQFRGLAAGREQDEQKRQGERP